MAKFKYLVKFIPPVPQLRGLIFGANSDRLAKELSSRHPDAISIEVMPCEGNAPGTTRAGSAWTDSTQP